MTETAPVSRSPATVAAAATPGLLSLAVAVVVAALLLAREVLIPITVAVLLSFAQAGWARGDG